MREQFDGLALVADERMEGNPLGGALFLFCNRERRILKALFWDGPGFAGSAASGALRAQPNERAGSRTSGVGADTNRCYNS